MKLIIYILVLSLLISTVSFAEDSATKIWGDQFGFTKEIKLVSDKQGNLYISGTTDKNLDSSFIGGYDAFIRKYSPSGDIAWTIHLGGKSDDSAQSIAIDNNDNCYITGKTNGNVTSTNKGSDDIFIAKVDPSSKILWKKQYGTKLSDVPFAIVTDNKGNCYVTGQTEGDFTKPVEGSKDAFIIKIDPKGDIVWKQQYGTTVDECGQYITLDKNNNIYVLLSTKEILKYDNNGNFINSWKHNFKIAKGIIVDDTSNVYIGGNDGVNALLIKYNTDGQVVWQKSFGSGSWTGINGMKKLNDDSGNLLLGICQNWPECIAVSMCYDTEGNMKWSYALQDKDKKSICGQNVTSDSLGNIFITGFTNTNLFKPLTNNQDVFIGKFNISSK